MFFLWGGGGSPAVPGVITSKYAGAAHAFLRAQQQDVGITFVPFPKADLPAVTVFIGGGTNGMLHAPPPLSFPTPCRSPGGGGGDRHLVNPKFFVAAHCVVVWVTVLWGTATCIPCTHGRTFCSLSLKWNLIAQPCFPLGQV